MTPNTSGAGVNAADVPAKDLHQATTLSVAEVPAPAPLTTSRSGGQDAATAGAGEGPVVAAPPLLITVLGIPRPQGSHKAFVVGKKGGKQRAIVTDDSPKTKPWKQTVKHAAVEALQGRLIQHGADTLHAVHGPASVTITFRLPRPKGHYGSGRNEHLVKPGAPPFPAVKPDLDKLARSTLDALGEAGVWNDDAQVVQLQVRKVYAGRDGLPGAHIEIRQAAS